MILQPVSRNSALPSGFAVAKKNAGRAQATAPRTSARTRPQFIDGLRPADYRAMRAPGEKRPLFSPFSLIMRLTGLEVEAGQHLSAFLLYGGQLSGIETERRQDRRRDLVGLDWAGNRPGGKTRI